MQTKVARFPRQVAVLLAAVVCSQVDGTSSAKIWSPLAAKSIRIWDEDPRHFYPYYLGAYQIKTPYFPYSYRGKYSRERHENSLNPYEVVGFHYIPYSKLGRALAYIGDRLVHTERKQYGTPNFFVPHDVREPDYHPAPSYQTYPAPPPSYHPDPAPPPPSPYHPAAFDRRSGEEQPFARRTAIGSVPATFDDEAEGSGNTLERPPKIMRNRSINSRNSVSFDARLPGHRISKRSNEVVFPKKLFNDLFEQVYIGAGDVRRVWGDGLGNMFGPVFVVVAFLVVVTIAVWLFSSAVSVLTLPLRFFFGIKAPVLRRFIVRLISYYGQDMVNKLQTNFPFVGNLQVPAEGLLLSKPIHENIPGFTLSVPATTITYTYNLSGNAAAKLQALVDAFNEVFNVRAATGRSLEDEEAKRVESLTQIAAEMRQTVGDKCGDDPTAVRPSATQNLCNRVNHALRLAESLMPTNEDDRGERNQLGLFIS